MVSAGLQVVERGVLQIQRGSQSTFLLHRVELFLLRAESDVK